MKDFEKHRERVLQELRLIDSFVRFRESHSGGFALWRNDWLREDLHLLEEAKGSLSSEEWKTLVSNLIKEKDKDMPTPEEQKLYFAARNRAIERLVDTNNLTQQLSEGFSRGLAAADPSHIGTEADDPKLYMPRIETETNFGLGFVLGVVARMEALKGKAYQASWQKKGEKDGAMVNVERKYDRLDATVRSGSTGETKCQILGDLVVYGMKWLALRAEMDPEEFVKWVKEVQKL